MIELKIFTTTCYRFECKNNIRIEAIDKENAICFIKQKGWLVHKGCYWCPDCRKIVKLIGE